MRGDGAHTTDVLQLGQIKRLVRDRGFGFILSNAGKEYFFHRSVLDGLTFDLLAEGDPVQFRPEDSAKGPRAGFVTNGL